MTITKGRVPTIIFFEPTNQFLSFAERMADGRPFIDVGAGAGLLAHRLSERGLKVLAIDILPRSEPLHKVYELDATTFQFPVPSLPIMARPCHNSWIEEAVDNAMQKLTQFIYVGLEKNFDQDLSELRTRYKLRVQSFVAGKDGEKAVCIYRLPQFKTP